MGIFNRLVLPHQIKPTLLFQTLIDKGPGAILVLVNFTLAIIGPTTGSVQKVLVAGSDGTNAGGPG